MASESSDESDSDFVPEESEDEEKVTNGDEAGRSIENEEEEEDSDIDDLWAMMNAKHSLPSAPVLPSKTKSVEKVPPTQAMKKDPSDKIESKEKEIPCLPLQTSSSVSSKQQALSSSVDAQSSKNEPPPKIDLPLSGQKRKRMKAFLTSFYLLMNTGSNNVGLDGLLSQLKQKKVDHFL
jgi:hypothetical protein